MVRFQHEKVLMTDKGQLLKNQLVLLKDGTATRYVTLIRRGIRSQAASEGEDFVIGQRTFRMAGEAAMVNFNPSIVPLPGLPGDFTGEVKRILLSLEVWDGPHGDRTQQFPTDSECEIWIVPSPPQLDVKLAGLESVLEAIAAGGE